MNKESCSARFSACGGAADATIFLSAAVRSCPEGFLYHRKFGGISCDTKNGQISLHTARPRGQGRSLL
ncbi:hypothetical protein CLOM621_06082 [Clostridium sp. M62/1]|nr:hypothetical protein CLOM621_06082 [Clostridium sp. M62/1]